MGSCKHEAAVLIHFDELTKGPIAPLERNLKISKEILKGNENMLNNYIKFLSTGSDKWPEEAFKILGIDLTDSLVYKEAIDYFKDLTENLKNIYYDKEVNESE